MWKTGLHSKIVVYGRCRQVVVIQKCFGSLNVDSKIVVVGSGLTVVTLQAELRIIVTQGVNMCVCEGEMIGSESKEQVKKLKVN
jgi:hypothetical protein